MWLVFAFHSNIHYKAFLLGNLPMKGAELKIWKDRAFMHFGDTKPSSVFIGPDLRFQTCGTGLQGPLVFTRGRNPYASQHQTVPAHCTQNITYITLLQINVDVSGFIYVKALVNNL